MSQNLLRNLQNDFLTISDSLDKIVVWELRDSNLKDTVKLLEYYFNNTLCNKIIDFNSGEEYIFEYDENKNIKTININRLSNSLVQDRVFIGYCICGDYEIEKNEFEITPYGSIIKEKNLINEKYNCHIKFKYSYKGNLCIKKEVFSNNVLKKTIMIAYSFNG